MSWRASPFVHGSHSQFHPFGQSTSIKSCGLIDNQARHPTDTVQASRAPRHRGSAMRQKLVWSLLQAGLIFAPLASIDAAGAGPMHPSMPPITVASDQLQQVAQKKIPSLNGYRGSSSGRPGYIKSSNGYWYPSRAFDDYTGSIGRPQNPGNTCNYGFTPTNGSSNCNY